MERERFLLGLVLTLLLCTSCFEEDVPGIDEPVEKEQQQSSDEQESQQEDDSEYDDADDLEENDTTLPLPQTRTIQEARSLTLSTPDQPSKDEIKSCQQEVANLSETVISSKALSEAKMALRKKVAEKVSLYHWCYLHRLVKLEDELVKADQTMHEKVNTLFVSFKDIWLLATALDIATEAKSYFKLSKEFYLHFNKEYLGRDLSPALPPVSADIALPREPPVETNTQED